MKEQWFIEAMQLYTLAISLCNDNAIPFANRWDKNVKCFYISLWTSSAYITKQ